MLLRLHVRCSLCVVCNWCCVSFGVVLIACCSCVIALCGCLRCVVVWCVVAVCVVCCVLVVVCCAWFSCRCLLLVVVN